MWKNFIVYYWLLLDFTYPFTAGNFRIKDHAVVYPEKIVHHSRTKREIFTKLPKENNYEENIRIKLPLEDKNVVLNLKKKKPHHADSILLRTFDQNGIPQHSKREVHDCHYEGNIENFPTSNVYLSTCRGLHGSIYDGKDSYDIMPMHDNGNGAHKLKNVGDILKDVNNQLMKDALAGTDTKITAKHNDPPTKYKEAPNYSAEFMIGDVESQYLPYLQVNQTRFIEAFVSVDHEIYGYYENDTKIVLERVLSTIGQVDMAYQAINIRIVVVAIEIQTNGPTFKRQPTGGGDLGAFTDYVAGKVRTSKKMRNIPFDNAILLSHRAYRGSVIGMAFVGAVCSKLSASVNKWSFTDISGSAVVIGHELGHNLNFPHDVRSCLCLTERGCFMSQAKSTRPGFSDCNLKMLAKKDFPCLSNYPVMTIAEKCGNGIIEGDEECDCGTPEMCVKNDPCCQPYRCKLQSHAQCSYQNNPQCCSIECLFKKQGILCRGPRGNCDVPEFCTGVSPQCPSDNVVRNGIHCGDSIKMLVGSGGRNKVTTTRFPRPVFGRYFQFAPKMLSKHKITCMKIEMMGCGKDEGVPNKPTPIQTHRLFYVKPMCIVLKDIKSCKQEVPDGTSIVYLLTKNRDCDHEHMLFIHKKDGTLVHKCSGKVVCPDPRNNLVIVSSKCKPENSGFVRTAKLSLKHVATNRCMNSFNYWPQSGNKIALRGCDASKERTTLIFLKTDCMLPIGFENNNLPDSAFSASSYVEKHPPKQARIGHNGWCVRTTKGNSTWLMVDLGKVKRITELRIGGLHFRYVTGFHLKYSDDGKHWQPYKESHATSWKDMNSYCHNGDCIPTYDHQCKTLWSADAHKAANVCWNKLNTNVKERYGTCNPLAPVACNKADIYCGQLQCSTNDVTPYYINYGKMYKKLKYGKQSCSGAVISNIDEVGLGMVLDGTKCGPGMMCVNRKCKNIIKHGVKRCLIVDKKECNGNGVCRRDGVCHCENGFNPLDGCVSKLIPVDGGWSEWSSWSKCQKACGGGQRTRYRYCNQPVARHGGKYCPGEWKHSGACNAEPCPVARTCRALKLILESHRKPLYDGVYTIQPKKGVRIKTYCDFTRDDGGWTLILTSHTNKWTADNVELRNADKPSLREDFSILKYADEIKFSYLSSSPSFEYRLEANQFGQWGGIFSAPSVYAINSNNSKQTNIKLLKKFSDWGYSRHGIEKRLPYLYENRLTTSSHPKYNFWGTLTDNRTRVTPANWISGRNKMEIPNWIWYWIRESSYSYPKSCLETMYRGYHEEVPFKNGVYRIEPQHGHLVLTFCDFDRHGGGWTLIANTTNSTVWRNREDSLKHGEDPSGGKFSILNYVDDIKKRDPSEGSFQYMIEADGPDQNGGIFSLPVDFSLLVCPPRDRKPKILKKFGDWNESENIAQYAIHSAAKNDEIFLTASTDDIEDVSGTLISNKGSGQYMTSLERPRNIRVWIREGGTRLSCNDIKIHGLHKGKTGYKDDFYLLNGSQTVYCDMTTTKNEGWTLLVTSVSKGWNLTQVLSRNRDKPSLTADYSILEQGDDIKKLSHKDHFKYMLDAHSRRHWGGIWSSNKKNSFVSNKWSRYKTVLIKQFDKWEYNKNWWANPHPRLPYLGNAKKNKALLTTASYSYWHEWGSIVSGESTNNPAMWITPSMPNPNVIWYWVNENDCDDDYKPIHGGFEEWSLWTPCSSYCEIGKQTRRRTCTAPVPRCGGDPCPMKEATSEEKPCKGACHATAITTYDDRHCLLPEHGSCNVTKQTRLVFKPAGTHCKKKEAYFLFNPSTGELIHRCSKMSVCPKSGLPNHNNPIVLSSDCPKPTLQRHFSRTFWNTLQFGALCVGPENGRYADGVGVSLYGRCDLENKKLIFLDLAPGSVDVSIYYPIKKLDNIEAVKRDSNFPHLPKVTGPMDNLDSPYNIGSHFGLRMQTYFHAPQNGNYIFVAACDDFCQVFLSEHKDAERKLIVDLKNHVGHYQWKRHPHQQRSKEIKLEVGKKYFLEVIFGEIGGADFAQVGVYLPDGTAVLPVTSDYLSSSRSSSK